MSASDVIKKLMKKTKLTSRGLARALGFPENAVSYYVNDKRKPNILNCYRIMKFAKKYDMDVSLEELLPG
jgi:transcriptional regulator with XRE-family HTH domain